MNGIWRFYAPISRRLLLWSGASVVAGLALLLMALLIPYLWRNVLFVPDLACPPPRGLAQ